MSTDRIADPQEHSWAWDEDSNGTWYRFCTRCGRYESQCLPNDTHGPIGCEKKRVRT